MARQKGLFQQFLVAALDPLTRKASVVEYFKMIEKEPVPPAGLLQFLFPEAKRTKLPKMNQRAWFSMYYKILNAAAYEYKGNRLKSFAELLMNSPLPKPNEHLQLTCPSPSTTSLKLRRPNDIERPLIGVDLVALFDSLNPAQVMHLVYYVLTERRIVVYGKRLGRVTSVVHALCAILYPFQWHHVLVPVVPEDLLSYVSAPMPFLVGVHKSMMKLVRTMPMEEAVFVDLDQRQIRSPFQSLFPVPFTEQLSADLDRALSGEIGKAMSQQIAASFEKFYRSIVQGCEKFTVVHPEKPGKHVPLSMRITWDKEKFVALPYHTKQTKKFLELFCQSQMSERYVVEMELARRAKEGRGKEAEEARESLEVARSRPSVDLTGRSPPSGSTLIDFMSEVSSARAQAQQSATTTTATATTAKQSDLLADLWNASVPSDGILIMNPTPGSSTPSISSQTPQIAQHDVFGSVPLTPSPSVTLQQAQDLFAPSFSEGFSRLSVQQTPVKGQQQHQQQQGPLKAQHLSSLAMSASGSLTPPPHSTLPPQQTQHTGGHHRSASVPNFPYQPPPVSSYGLPPTSLFNQPMSLQQQPSQSAGGLYADPFDMFFTSPGRGGQAQQPQRSLASQQSQVSFTQPQMYPTPSQPVWGIGPPSPVSQVQWSIPPPSAQLQPQQPWFPQGR